MKTAASFLIALLLCACNRPPPCIDGHPHKWGPWSDEWKQVNNFGYLQQRRYCQKCGLVEIESHSN